MVHASSLIQFPRRTYVSTSNPLCRKEEESARLPETFCYLWTLADLRPSNPPGPRSKGPLFLFAGLEYQEPSQYLYLKLRYNGFWSDEKQTVEHSPISVMRFYGTGGYMRSDRLFEIEINLLYNYFSGAVGGIPSSSPRRTKDYCHRKKKLS